MKSLLLLAITGATFLTLPANAAKIDFSPDVAGTYKGTFFAQSGDSSAIGNVTVRVRVPRSGRSATIGINGFAVAEQIAIPIQGKLRLKANRKVKANSSLLGLYGPTATKPSRLKGRKSPFKFRLVARPDAILFEDILIASMNYTLRFGANSISINGTGVAGFGDSLLPFTIRINADN